MSKLKMPVKIGEIRKILPHRFPFLMVDRVIELEEDRIVAIKNVTVNEPFFQGHFPEVPLMPGVMQLEALTQAAGLFLPLSDPTVFGENGEKIGVFSKVNNCTFESPVVPGDQLRLEATKFQIERNQKGDPKRVSAHAEASVDGKVSCRCDLEFAIIPTKLINR
ncbi:putative beta-hydroxyacyl-(acyl-carrier-protein) dehydratase FabZ [Leptospira broomii serovar Hurstbridge str. 5399]|uniref:3-hydroxyacyl-[acyl-carrier-protein] dehydratase n=2 Tax=Leptospira broomii TaxID=301541 RepID=T0GDZ5_9LEPT|nr:3-hydroxyacyl-ACP dehydratase FabZ [Leptospira broomii]EQA43608.1 putative beta-hydroxyacyl-(acyl-carrier-protein) dehydratase FabZ [Leptospira broomii serovar Hurstbridge str. 5399]